MIKSSKFYKKSDSISHLILVNGKKKQKRHSPTTSHNSISRIIALSSSGTAYCVEVELVPNEENNSSGGGASTSTGGSGAFEITLGPILGRMEGIVTASDHHNATGVTGSTFSYDADRDFLIAMLAGGKLAGVWDLSNIAALARSSKTTPVLKPFLTMKLSGYDSGNNSSIFVVPSMQYSSFPDTALACWMGNKATGEISVLLSTFGTKEGTVIKPTFHFSCSLSSFQVCLSTSRFIDSLFLLLFFLSCNSRILTFPLFHLFWVKGTLAVQNESKLHCFYFSSRILWLNSCLTLSYLIPFMNVDIDLFHGYTPNSESSHHLWYKCGCSGSFN